VLRPLTPYALLTLLWLLFFHALVLHPDWVLYSDHSDLIAEHVPAKRVLVRSFHQTGELPRWYPYQFAGAPFLHDVQVAAFYPPHALLLPLDEARVGAALSWLLAAHVLLAGWLMHAYARSQGLGTYGSFVAAVGYMFAGKWMLHLLAAGHYVLVGLTWLPLVLLCLERAIRRGRLAWATAAAVAFALLTLGTHPQWTFYAGLLVVVWTLPAALEVSRRAGGVDPPRSPHGELTPPARRVALFRWAGYGLWAALLGAGLSAVQLLPTAEAASYSIRSVPMQPQDLRVEFDKAMPQLFGPGPTGPSWEYRGGLGALWAAAAAAAPVLCRGRVRLQAAVLLGILLLALGGAVLLQPLPGFRSFRTPVRMLVLAALPLATLAGATTQALFEQPLPPPAARRRCFLVMLGTSAVALIVMLWDVRRLGPRLEVPVAAAYWQALRLLPLTLPAFLVLVLFRLRGRQRLAGSALAPSLGVALLLADLGSLAWPLVQTRSDEDLFAPSACVRYLIDRQETDRDTPWRVVDQGSPDDADTSALGTGYVLAPICRLQGLGGYNPLDVLRTRQFLQFVGGSDRPVRPLEAPLGYPALSGFPLRDKKLLDLLGVRFLLRTRSGPWEPMEGEQPGDWTSVKEDEHPRAYNFARGGLRDLPPYEVLENQTALPRAFVVPQAKPLPEDTRVLAALKETDFRRTVLLEGWRDEFAGFPVEGTFREVRVQDYRPNRVRLEVPDGAAGWLVLADVWYPGWVCTMDGREADIHRANYLFRAVRLEAGSHEVVFEYKPRSYFIGRIVSVGTLAVVAVVLGFAARRSLTVAARP
jgi:hypothetical protein